MSKVLNSIFAGLVVSLKTVISEYDKRSNALSSELKRLLESDNLYQFVDTYSINEIADFLSYKVKNDSGKFETVKPLSTCKRKFGTIKAELKLMREQSIIFYYLENNSVNEIMQILALSENQKRTVQRVIADYNAELETAKNAENDKSDTENSDDKKSSEPNVTDKETDWKAEYMKVCKELENIKKRNETLTKQNKALKAQIKKQETV